MSATILTLPVEATETVDLGSLTRFELEVVFYATGYRRTFDDVMNGVDLVHLVSLATPVANRLGRDLIREIARVVEYATLRYDDRLRAQVWPDRVRGIEAVTFAREFQIETGRPSALTLADTAARWHTALTCTAAGEAVAA